MWFRFREGATRRNTKERWQDGDGDTKNLVAQFWGKGKPQKIADALTWTPGDRLRAPVVGRSYQER